MGFSGFPSKVKFTPVPNQVFNQILEPIQDLSELKCTLRIIWLLHLKKDYPKSELITTESGLKYVRTNEGTGEKVGKGKKIKAHYAHLLIHGYLHLLGYSHEKQSDADKMEKKEVQTLKKNGFQNPY